MQSNLSYLQSYGVDLPKERITSKDKPMTQDNGIQQPKTTLTMSLYRRRHLVKKKLMIWTRMESIDSGFGDKVF
jgi:hypothetical protein